MLLVDNNDYLNFYKINDNFKENLTKNEEK